MRQDSAEVYGDKEVELRRLRRRMFLWVLVVLAAGMTASLGVLRLGTHRGLYRQHYEFRRYVRIGVSAEEVVLRFGPPYRTYWTLRSVLPVLEGRGVYRRFDRLPDPRDPSQGWPPFEKILHYRTTLEHGEFVFIGPDGRVTWVMTGLRKQDEYPKREGHPRTSEEESPPPPGREDTGQEPDTDDP